MKIPEQRGTGKPSCPISAHNQTKNALSSGLNRCAQKAQCRKDSWCLMPQDAPGPRPQARSFHELSFTG